MNKLSAARILSALVFIVGALPGPAFSDIKLSQSVITAASSAGSAEYLELILSFENDLDRSALKMNRLRGKQSWVDNYNDVLNRLQNNRRNLENDLLPRFEEMKSSGLLNSYKFYTVSKKVLIEVRADQIDILKQLPGISMIHLNETVSLIRPVDESLATSVVESQLANAGLDAINIRSLWSRGLKGEGSLIASFDTGVDGAHPALGPKWRGNNGATAAASWYAPHGDSIPADKVGHGSHVMGIMVGDIDGDTLGVAPDAQWISAAVIDQGASFSTTIADILSAFDWVLNPDGDVTTTNDVPDVICNSWGVPRGIYGDCDNTFWTAIDNVEAAGIVTVFAAGNEGPDLQSIRNPADRASSPTNSLSVGAIDAATLTVAEFSSRGPANCDNSMIKPEVVAPGVGVYSTYKGSTYKTMSGTSMAAPFVAGLVALARQYNPDATVEEIKNALLSATTDLGNAGEDNSYGHGLIDASRLLDYISPPSRPAAQVESHLFSSGGDGFADPGETAELALTLFDPTGLMDSVDIWLGSNSDQFEIAPDTIRFYFQGGSPYAVSQDSFTLMISPEAISGQPAALSVYQVLASAKTIDSTVYNITIGRELPGQMMSLSTGDIQFSVSDFGMFGFGPGSIYQAGGEGFKFAGSGNLMFEAGLIVSRDGSLISDGIRDEVGNMRISDFLPVGNNPDLSSMIAGERFTLSMTDNNSIIPLPAEIDQSLLITNDNFIIIEYEVTNPKASRVDELAYGIFFDFDIDRLTDRVGFDTSLGMLYQYNEESGIYIGITGLSGDNPGYRAGQNIPPSRIGFNKQQKYDLIKSSGLIIEGSGQGDWYLTISGRETDVEAFGSGIMAFAMVAAGSLNELRSAAEMARVEYEIALTADDIVVALPVKAQLSQNYPNPFNPQTSIGFTLGSTQNVALNVYNINGQLVRSLYEGRKEAGEWKIEWDSRDNSGITVSSGVYFYRLVAGEETLTKKMVLLK